MIVVADTHAHLYPCYDVARFLSTARQRLTRLAAGAHVLCLTERASESAFAEISRDRLVPEGWRVLPCAEPTALRLETGDGFALTLIAGRQVVTAERLEALAIGIEAALPDGLTLSETLARIRTAGGVPVLPWSPGKWLGRRGRIVQAALAAARPGDLLVGDTALRPSPSPEPSLFALARRRGLGVAAGSDPLPMPGEERQIGRYATVGDAAFSLDRPSTALCALLRTGNALSSAGSRRSPLSFAMAWTRHTLSARH